MFTLTSYFSDIFNSSWTVAILVILVSVYYWYSRPGNFPPGPRGVPLLGVIPFAGSVPQQAFKKWSKKYGPVMSVRMGREDWVVLNDYESVYQALMKQHTKFSGRPHIPMFDVFSRGGYGVAFADYGPHWMSQRKFGLVTLRGFGVGKRSMENRILEELSVVIDSIRLEDDKAFHISDKFVKSMSNNICSVALGKRFEYDDPKFKEIMKNMLEILDDPNIANAINVMTLSPLLMNVPPFKGVMKMLLDNVKTLMHLLEDVIQDHEDTFDEKDLRDFIDAFLLEIKKNEDPSFTKIQLVQFVFDLFIAGLETSTSTLGWAFLCLVCYPESQRKLRQEIMDVVGAYETITMAHKARMPYTNAFMHEVFRYKTIVPLSLPHMTSEDAELNGYLIPKGTTVAPNLWAVHNDPEYWDEPEKFKPERFLDENGDFVKNSHVVAFSLGPRHCLGEQLARMEIFMFIVGLIRKFEFLPDPEAKDLPVIDVGCNGFTYGPLAYKVVAKEL